MGELENKEQIELNRDAIERVMEKLSVVESLKDSILQLNKFLLGNGQKGIIERVTITESMVKDQYDNISTLRDVVDKTNSSVEELRKLVQDHITDTKKHDIKSMIFNRDTLVTIAVVFIIFHTIIEQGGPVLEFLKKLIGLG